MSGSLIFDGDCGFCTSSARLLKRIAPRVRVVPWQTADLAALGLTEAQCRRAVQWAGDDRSHAAAETAIARALSAGAPWWRAAGLAILLLRPISTAVYWLVAKNRSHLPGGPPACSASVP